MISVLISYDERAFMLRRGSSAPRGTRPGQLCIDTLSDLRNAYTKFQIFNKEQWNSKKENEQVILDVFELQEPTHTPLNLLTVVILITAGWQQ